MDPYYLDPVPKSLLIWTYAIGCFDLMAALLFTVVGLQTMSRRLSWLIIFAILFGIFWISMTVVLLLGIHGRKPRLVRAWIIFSCASILAEIILFLYGILSGSCYQNGLVSNGILLLIALIVEFIFLFIVHRFYVTLAYCQIQCGSPLSSESDPVCHSPCPFSKGTTHHTSLANPMRLSSLPTVDKHSAL